MKKIIYLLSLTMFSTVIYAQAGKSLPDWEYNDSTEFIITKEMVTDTALIIAEYRHKIDSIKTKRDLLNTFLNVKGKLDDDLYTQYAIFYNDIKQWFEKSGRNSSYDDIRNYNTSPQYGNYYRNGYRPSFDYQDKQLEKRKVSKEMKEIIENVINKNCQRKIDKLTESIENNDLHLYYVSNNLNGKKYPQKEISLKKKNEKYRPKVFMDLYYQNYFGHGDAMPSKYFDYEKKMLRRGWEWLDSYDRKEEEENYPIRYSYYRYNSHPQYKVKYGAPQHVFDLEGNLVYVEYLGWNHIDDIINHCLLVMDYRKDYEANKYNIKSEDEKVQYALQNQLGYSDEGANKMLHELADGVVADLELSLAQYKKQKREAKQRGMEAGFGFISELLKVYNPTANNYIKQLRKDHENDYKYLYRIKRLDGVSFKMEFVKMESGIAPVCDVYVSYYLTEPYKIDYSVNKVVRY